MSSSARFVWKAQTLAEPNPYGYKHVAIQSGLWFLRFNIDKLSHSLRAAKQKSDQQTGCMYNTTFIITVIYFALDDG